MNDTTIRTLESLSKRRLPELQARFAEIVGEPARSPNKTFLLRRIGGALEGWEQQTNAEPTTPATTTTEASPKVRLAGLSVAELRAMYREVVGRETRSSDSAYLIWKLRQAQGRVRVGPVARRAPGEAADVTSRQCRCTILPWSYRSAFRSFRDRHRRCARPSTVCRRRRGLPSLTPTGMESGSRRSRSPITSCWNCFVRIPAS